MKQALVFAALLAALGPAQAAEDERERIAAERRVIEAHFAAASSTCREQFFVTACLDEARARRRAELAPLRERELRIDEAERLARAVERLAAIAAKQAAAASRPAAEPVVRPAKAPASAASSAERAARARDHSAAQAAEAAAAAERASAAARRREDTRQTQERIARRLAEKEAQGKKAQPLPVPAAAASAAR